MKAALALAGLALSTLVACAHSPGPSIPAVAQTPFVTPSAPPKAGDPIEVAQASVVLILVSLRGREVASGSGVILADRTYVMTNQHVVAAGDSYEIVLAPPRSARTSTTGIVVDQDAVRDLAVLKLSNAVGSPALIADRPPSLGAPLVIAGYPGVGGDTLTVTKGTVSGFVDRSDGLGPAWLKTDAAINRGNSGGAALNDRGELVGIPTFVRRSGGDSLAYILSVEASRGFLDGAVRKTARIEGSHGFLQGVPASTSPPATRQTPTLPPTPAVSVDSIAGVWRGSYWCRQGVTGLTLTILQAEGRLVARFEFYPLPQNRSAASGAYLMTGTLVSGRMVLRGDRWLDQPPGYAMVGLLADVDTGDLSRLQGTVNDPACSLFSLVRGQ